MRIDNQSGNDVTAWTSVKVPASLKLAGSASHEAFLPDGGTFITPTAGSVSGSGAVATGDNMSWLWAVLAVFAMGGIAALLVYGKNRKQTISLLLCLAMISGATLPAVTVEAADLSAEMEVSCIIQVDGKDEEVSATISYTIYGGAEDEAEEPGSDPSSEPSSEPVDYKDDAYTRMLFVEDFEGDTKMDTTVFQLSGNDSGFKNYINVSVDDGAINDYLKINHQDGIKDTHQLSMKFGKGTNLQNSGEYKSGDTTRFKVSFDICPTTATKNYTIKLRDKFSNTSSAKTEDIIKFYNNGQLQLGQVKVIDYTANEWLHFDIFFEFTGATGTSTYAIYVNDEFMVEEGTKKLTHLVESIGLSWSCVADSAAEHTICMDNLSIATVVTQ